MATSNQPTSYIDKLAEQSAKNRLAVRGFFIVVLLGAGGYYALRAHTEKYENKAQNAYFDGEKSYQEALAAIAPKQPAPDKNAKNEKKPPELAVDPKKADTAQAETKLQ